jgi:hypothetical protein
MSKDTSNAVATIDPGAIMEAVIAKGDLKNLSPQERAMYYKQTCDSMGLNPLTKPFQYITLNNQLQLYATRTAADQLRKINGVTLVSLDRRYEPETEMYEVSARMRDKDGREDEDISAVFVGNLKGDALGNARKKAVTQAKRRCTLSLCGLGWLDETEIDQIPEARRMPVSSYVPDDEPTVDIAEADYEEAEVINQKMTERQRKFVFAIAAERNISEPSVKQMVQAQFGKGITELDRREASIFIDDLTAFEPVTIRPDGEVIDGATGEITPLEIAEMQSEADAEARALDGLSPVDELLARTYAATTLDQLEAIRKEKNDNGINDEELADAWRTRFKELGGRAHPVKVKQPALVGAAAGVAGDDPLTR